MRTLGIDFAASPERTSACRIDWSTGEIDLFPRPATDDELVTAAADVDLVGIDVPLGWPDGFVAAVSAHHAGEPWPSGTTPPPEDRVPLRYRRTDVACIHGGLVPLSVSTDRIGVTALRGARIQHALVRAGLVVDRSGTTGSVAEVYPAGALRAWGLPHRGYKRAANAVALRDLVHQFSRRCGRLGAAVADALDGGDDDDLDAVVCAVVARAVLLGATTRPEPHDLGAAQREGWIHLPTIALEAIVDPSP